MCLKTIFNFNELELVLFTDSVYVHLVHESTNCFCLYFFFCREMKKKKKHFNSKYKRRQHVYSRVIASVH